MTPPTNKDYIKHILECKCILPQYRNAEPPVFHKFMVFSELNEKADIVPSYAQCNNCGVIHKVIEVGVSRLMKKENMPALMKIEDYREILPPKMVGLLELHDCPLATWQEADFILKNEMWGRGFVLARELDGSTLVGKFIAILGKDLYDIRPFEREEEVTLT